MQIKDQIKSEILLNKRIIRLDKFIEKALFEKNSYYSSMNPIGSGNDFITSPEISQIFGEIIGSYILHFWTTKINSKFNLIELGPGQGTLFKDIYNSSKREPIFLKNAKITFVEKNKELIKVQKKIVDQLKLKNVTWKKNLNLRSKFPSIIYSNEFFDCFPVRQFVFKDFWLEKFISFNKFSNSFFFKEKKVLSENLINLLKNYENEKIFELSNKRNEYFENICKFIKKNGGIIIVIDYGYNKKIKNFTLQSIYKHRISRIFENIGKQDISSFVNFSELIDIAKKNKLKIDEFCSQRKFLIKYGIIPRKEILSKKLNNEGKKLIESQVKRLIDENIMGNIFKCLIISNL